MSKSNSVEFNAPRYEPNLSFFGAVMNNITLIDNSLAGFEGYSEPNIPLLVDALIAKVLNEDKFEELTQYKKDTIKEYTDGIKDNIEKNQKILSANIAVYAKCVKYFAQYLTFETRLAVMKS